jgi:hypothetical protein
VEMSLNHFNICHGRKGLIILGVLVLTSLWTFVPWLPPLIPLAESRRPRERPLPAVG